MNKIIVFGAVLIGIFLFLVYYKGAGADIGAGSSAIDKLILLFQGRNNHGVVANYPH